MLQQNSQVDRIIVQTTGGTATIGEILIDDVDAQCWRVDMGRHQCWLYRRGEYQFGDGTGINSASAVFNDTVKARVITDNLVDTPISVK
jgi:hypothetical protein